MDFEDGQHAVLIDVGAAAVGLDGEVGLAGAVAVYLTMLDSGTLSQSNSSPFMQFVS